MSGLLKTEIGKKIYCKLNNKEIEICEENEGILLANFHYHLFDNKKALGSLKTKKESPAQNGQIDANSSSQRTLMGSKLSQKEFCKLAENHFEGSPKLAKKEIISILTQNGVELPTKVTLSKLAEITLEKLG